MDTNSNQARRVVIGITAHVDAGKTTLAEAMLYRTGRLRKLGRVDHGSAAMDSHLLERERGITIFSSQAELPIGNLEVTLLDTPGHVDFSAEMERTLSVLDYAILVISGADGVQAHTRTLWRLLELYRIPTFLFVTKMDFGRCGREQMMEHLRHELGEGCVDFTPADRERRMEQLATCREDALEAYLDGGEVPDALVRQLVGRRLVFPCWFGSGLKLEGIDCYALPNATHIWTVATLDGKTVHIDTTWGDQGNTGTKQYFAMTPEQSYSLHSWPKENELPQ